MLPSDIKSLVDLVIQSPENEASLRALLVLLDNAPDSDVIIEALEAVEPLVDPSDELRKQASDLLIKADVPELASKWKTKAKEKEELITKAENVVTFKSGQQQNDPEPHDHPEVKSMTPSTSFKDIGGLENVKSQIRRKIIKPFENPSLFKKFKRRAGGGVLMYGPPGCGKTMMARALANECDAVFIEARASDILDKYQGIAEKRISALFEKARTKKPAVLFFDEVEALAQRRQNDSLTNVNTIVSALLNEMDGFGENNEGILFLGATNVPWALDSAFKRPGRFDRTIFVPPPDRVAREFILKGLLSDRPVRDDLDIQKIIKKSSGFSGADMQALVEAAIDYAIEESEDVDDLKSLSQEHFEEAFIEIRPSIGEWLGLAQSYSEYATKDGLYDDLRAFLKKHG